MANQVTTIRPVGSASARSRRRAGASKVKFGDVTVTGARPTAEAVRLNVARSTEALERVGKRLLTPGVRLPRKKGVPRFSVVESEPGVFIRELNGRVDRGRLVDGVFQVID